MSATTLSYPFSERTRALVPGLAISSLISTVLLILVGSIVRVTGNGLGCPDWPLCYGQPIPPALTGAWVEFSHRFLASLTTAQIVLLAGLVWKHHRAEKWIVAPPVVAVGLLVAQIALGALHVIFELPPATGWIHTGNAMLIVGAMAVVAARTIPALQPMRHSVAEHLSKSRFANWTTLNTVMLYLLLLTGSYVTRSGASLACPAFPLCGTDTPALRQLIDIQMFHRFTAYAVAALTIGTMVWLGRRRSEMSLRRYSWVLGGLLITQISLGIANVLLRLPEWSRALHLTVGATFWAAMVILWTASRPAQSQIPR